MKTVAELMNLRGRVAMITGGAGHIGQAIADALAENGTDIVLLDTNESGNEIVGALSKRYKVKATALRVDLADEAALRAVPEQLREQFGRLDILVHAAALVGTSALQGWAVPFADQSAATWRQALEVNLTAPFILTQACAPMLVSSSHGSVIMINSIYGMVGPDWRLYESSNLGNPAAYAASKGGLMQLTRWLATTMAPAVRVNTITLGGVFRNHADPFLSRYVARTPLGRMTTEEDVKGAAMYLASDASSYVTGQNIVVDGGWTAW